MVHTAGAQQRVTSNEPFDGRLPWINPGFGCLGVLAGIFSRGPVFPVGPMILVQVSRCVCWRMSDLLPSENRWAILASRTVLLVSLSASFVHGLGF